MTRAKVVAVSAAILILAAAAGMLPRASVLSEETVRADIVSRLSSWSGGAIDVSGPFRLRYFPRLVLSTGTVTIHSAPNVPHFRRMQAKTMEVDLGLRSLLSDRADFRRITFTDPQIDLRAGNDRAAPADSASALVAVRALPVPELRIINGTVLISGPQTKEEITKIHFTASMAMTDGAVETTGDFVWREQQVTFDLSATAPAPDQAGAKGPVRLIVQAPLVSADLSGEGSITDAPRVNGSLDLEIGDVRMFSRWLGLLIPEGPGLGKFSAAGKVRWNGKRIAYNEGTYTLDDNRALGTLGIQFGGARPKIEGTLAFSTFDLARYKSSDLTAEAEQDPPTPDAKAATKPVATDFPVLHHLDVDLRLSTGDLVTPSFALGQVAVSARVKSGQLTADFAILDLCTGSGSGRLSFDPSQEQAPIRLTANLTRISAQVCVSRLLGQSPVAADLDLLVDLYSHGRTTGELLRALGGKVELEAGPGEVLLDLESLRSHPITRGLHGWQQFGLRATAFDKASAELIFRRGTIFSDDLVLFARESVYSGEGTVSLLEETLEFRLVLRNLPQGAPSTRKVPDVDPVAVARLQGPWFAPMIEIRRPGLGKSSESAGALTPASSQ